MLRQRPNNDESRYKLPCVPILSVRLSWKVQNLWNVSDTQKAMQKDMTEATR